MRDRILSVLLLAAVVAGMTALFLASRKKAAGVRVDGYNPELLKKTDTNLLLRVEKSFLKVQMSNLTAIAVDRFDRILVAGDKGVEILDTNGVRVAGFEVGSPVRCMALIAGTDVAVGLKDHVEIFECLGASGARKTVWESQGPKADFSSIAVSPEFVFVADYGSRIVWRYDHAGKLLGRIGDRDDGERKTGFVIPNTFFDVAVAGDGTIWVANPGLRRLEHFTADGKLLGSWGKSSTEAEGFCGCCNPAHIALMPDGSFVTSEKQIVRIKIYNAQGLFRGIVAGHESFKRGTVGLDLAVDSRGRILVLDPQAGGVRVYQIEKNGKN